MTDANAVSVTTLLSFLGLAGNNHNSQGFQRTVGTAATVGLSLTLLRFLVSAVKAAADEDNGNGDDGELLSRSDVLYQFMKSIVRRMLLLQGKSRGLIGNGDADDDESEDNVPIIHKGACHCRSVQFEVSSAVGWERSLIESFCIYAVSMGANNKSCL